METTTALQFIEKQAAGFTGYNPVAKVTCPHCGATMQAIDAKAHVVMAARIADALRPRNG